MFKVQFSLADIFSPEELKKIQFIDFSPEKIISALESQPGVEKAEYLQDGVFKVTPKKKQKKFFTFKIFY